MDPTDVRSHYGSPALGHELLSALEAAFGDSLDAAALRGVDQFHLGGHRATEALLDGLHLTSDDHVLDVGCGIGGVARDLRSRFGCTVTAVDLTPEFVDAARLLSGRVGADDGITFEVGDALDLACADGTFAAAVVVHVGMNIPDKAAMLAELHRVCRPGATVAVYDIMRRTDAPLAYPLPWTTDETTDCVESEDTYRSAMAAAGLELVSSADRTELVLEVIGQAASNPAPVNLAHLMGSAWPTMFGNLVTALRDGTVAPVELLARR